MEQDDIEARSQKVAEACLFELVDIYTEEILNGKRWEGGFGAGEKRVEVAQAVFQDAQVSYSQSNADYRGHRASQ